jgi:hypothetical protein
MFRPVQIYYKFRSFLQKLETRKKNIFLSEMEITLMYIYLFINTEAATYMMESELHGADLKILHNNMQRYKIIRIICRNSRHYHENCRHHGNLVLGFVQACIYCSPVYTFRSIYIKYISL